MELAKRNEKVQAFPPDASDQPLTEGINLGSLYGCLQYADTEAFQGFVGGRRKILSRSWIKYRQG